MGTYGDIDWISTVAGRPDRPWVRKALCVGMGLNPDVNPFFPTRVGERDRHRADDKAKEICRTCPVRLTCLEYALETEEEWGVWGGTGESHRRRWMREGVLSAAEMIELQDLMDSAP